MGCSGSSLDACSLSAVAIPGAGKCGRLAARPLRASTSGIVGAASLDRAQKERQPCQVQLRPARGLALHQAILTQCAPGGCVSRPQRHEPRCCDLGCSSCSPLARGSFRRDNRARPRVGGGSASGIVPETATEKRLRAGLAHQSLRYVEGSITAVRANGAKLRLNTDCG